MLTLEVLFFLRESDLLITTSNVVAARGEAGEENLLLRPFPVLSKEVN